MKTPLILVLALGLASCSSSSSPGGDPGSLVDCSDSAAPVQVAGALGEKPEITVPDSQPPCEMVTEDLQVGTGTEAVAGARLQMRYVGVSWSSGEEFDASWGRDQPFSFALGAGQVISGWDQGIAGMKVGGRRLLVIPSDLGYGDVGSGIIAGGETLVFVVDLVDVAEPPSCKDAPVRVGRGGKEAIVVQVTGKASEKPKVSLPDSDPSCELQKVDIIEGDGPVAEDGMTLKMQYVGISWSTGKQFDASWDRGDPFEFVLGTGGVIQGWDKGIAGMKVGGRRLLVIPSDMGYGPQGSPPAIQPFETLVFVVDLLKAEKK